MNYLGLLMAAILIVAAPAAGQSQNNQAAEKLTYTNAQAYQKVTLSQKKARKLKNVVLMIGDGMGLHQVSAAWVANHGQLNLDQFPTVGLMRTYAANRLITDSGAAGTAMATGQKTNYHSVGVDTVGRPLSSLAKLAHEKGLSTGVVVTCNLTDATPATFCAHHSDRDQEEQLALDFLSCGVDYIFGGGRKVFTQRTDQRNLMAEMEAAGYQTPSNWSATKVLEGGKVFSVLEDGQLPLAAERGRVFQAACLHALSLLDNSKDGFFAMFEGSRIDDCGHWNDVPKLMEEIFDFDQTIGRVLQWAEQDGETLVIVLADHETGGLTLLDGDIETGQVSGHFSTGGHSGILVPVYAYGPGAELFGGIYENTEVFEKIVKLLQLKR